LDEYNPPFSPTIWVVKPSSKGAKVGLDLSGKTQPGKRGYPEQMALVPVFLMAEITKSLVFLE
jgi:hypothetical protein